MTQQLTFDQAILVEGEHTGRLVQTARGKAFPIAAPGNCVHFFRVLHIPGDNSNSHEKILTEKVTYNQARV